MTDNELLQEIRSMTTHVKDLVCVVQSLLAFNPALYCFPWADKNCGKVFPFTESCTHNLLHPEAAYSWSTLPEKDLVAEDALQSVMLDMPSQSQHPAENVREVLPEKTFKDTEDTAAVCIRCGMKCQECSCSAYEADEEDDMCTACFLPFGEVAADGSWDGDACEVCCKPHHTQCLIELSCLTGHWEVCSSCAEKKRSDIAGDFRSLATDAWKAIDAPFLTQSARAQGPMANPAVPEGWPDLCEPQQATFRIWFMQRRGKHREVLQAALEHELSQAESEQLLEHAFDSRERVVRARKLQAQLQSLDDMEHMRKESWKFVRETAYAEDG